MGMRAFGCGWYKNEKLAVVSAVGCSSKAFNIRSCRGIKRQLRQCVETGKCRMMVMSTICNELVIYKTDTVLLVPVSQESRAMSLRTHKRDL